VVDPPYSPELGFRSLLQRFSVVAGAVPSLFLFFSPCFSASHPYCSSLGAVLPSLVLSCALDTTWTGSTKALLHLQQPALTLGLSILACRVRGVGFQEAVGTRASTSLTGARSSARSSSSAHHTRHNWVLVRRLFQWHYLALHAMFDRRPECVSF